MPLFGRGGRAVSMMSPWHRRLCCGSALCVLSRTEHAIAACCPAPPVAALVPISMSIATEIFPEYRRALALGIIGAAAEAGGVLGPVYGAGMASLGGWKLIFLVNVPLGALMGLGAWILLGNLLRHRVAPGGVSRVDYIGAALMAAALASLTIGLGGNSEVGALGVKPWWIAGSVIAFAVFVVWELRQTEPLVQLSFFKKIPFTAANIASFAVGAALVVGMVEIPLYAYSLLGEARGWLLLMGFGVIPVGAPWWCWQTSWVTR